MSFFLDQHYFYVVCPAVTVGRNVEVDDGNLDDLSAPSTPMNSTDNDDDWCIDNKKYNDSFDSEFLAAKVFTGGSRLVGGITIAVIRGRWSRARWTTRMIMWMIRRMDFTKVVISRMGI